MKIENLIKKWQIKTSAETDQRILADALTAMEKSTPADKPTFMTSILIKVACAAVIVIAGLSVAYYLSTQLNVGTIAWAQIAKEVGQIETFTYQLRTDITTSSPTQTYHAKTTLSFSSQHGIRLNTFVDGQ